MQNPQGQPPPPVPQQQPPQQPPQQPQQQQQVIIVQSQAQGTPKNPKTYDNYLHGQSTFLGIFQIVLGIVSIIANGVAMKFDREDHNEVNMSYSGCGIWAGLFFILIGAFGLLAAARKTMCPIVTFMVLSIVSVALINMAYIGLAAAGVGVADSHDCRYPYYNTWGGQDCLEYGKNKGLLGSMAVLLTCALLEPIIAIWSSIICCMAVCCGRRAANRQNVTTGTVQYTTVGPQGQMVVINSGQVGYPQGQITTAYPQQQGQVYVTGTNPGAYPTQPVYNPANNAPAYPYPPQGYTTQGVPPQPQGQVPPVAGPAPPAYNPSAPPPVYTEEVKMDMKTQ